MVAAGECEEGRRPPEAGLDVPGQRPHGPREGKAVASINTWPRGHKTQTSLLEMYVSPFCKEYIVVKRDFDKT